MVTTATLSTEKSPTEKTVVWVEAIVRWTREDSADIWVLPTTERGETIAQIHRGDLIQVRTDIKKDDWVPCRIGHVTGWLNISKVKLIQTGIPVKREVVHVEPPMPTNPIPFDETKKAKSNLIQRLIKFFK